MKAEQTLKKMKETLFDQSESLQEIKLRFERVVAGIRTYEAKIDRLTAENTYMHGIYQVVCDRNKKLTAENRRLAHDELCVCAKCGHVFHGSEAVTVGQVITADPADSYPGDAGCPNCGDTNFTDITEAYMELTAQIASKDAEIARLKAENTELSAWKTGKKGVEDYLEVAYNLNERNGQVKRLTADLAESKRRERDARNELCLKCGRYHESHNGACDGCRWKE